MEFTRRMVAATGYRLMDDLEAEEIEFGWRISAGDDIGAVRVQVLRLAQLHFEFETLKMWWQSTPGAWASLKGWFLGQSELPPGGHILWTPVLKARSEAELQSALEYAKDMREAMLARARRWKLQPISCRLFAMFGHSMQAEGETQDGLTWKASVKDERVRRLWDSAPIWQRLGRLVRPTVSSDPNRET